LPGVDNYGNFMYAHAVLLTTQYSAVASLEEAEGHQHWRVGTRVGANKVSPAATRVRVVDRDPRKLFVYFNTKSCILVHSLAPKMGTTSVFIKTFTHWRK